MPELHDLLDRRASRHEPAPDLFDRVLDRRRRRDRHRRLMAGFVALALVGTSVLLLVRTWGSTTPIPADQPPEPSGIVGEWSSIDYNAYFGGADDSSHQQMTIRTGEGGLVHVRAYADETSGACWDRRPGENPRYVFFGRTMTGTGLLENPTTLVVPSPVVTCTDGSRQTEGPSRLEEPDSYRLVLDPATGRLYDNLGVVWIRGAPPEHWASSPTEAGVDGPGTFAMLHGEVTFRAADPWIDHIESYLDPRLFFLVTGRGGGEEAYVEILVNPLPPDTPCDSVRFSPPADELVEAIRSNPDLETTTPLAARVGGIDALRMDVAAAPGASSGCDTTDVPVVSVPGRGAWGDVSHGGLGRLYVLDLPGGSARTLAIWIGAPDAAQLLHAVESAAPILDSFEFHAG